MLIFLMLLMAPLDGAPTAAAATCDEKCEAARQDCSTQCRMNFWDTSQEKYNECLHECSAEVGPCQTSCNKCSSDCAQGIGSCVAHCPGQGVGTEDEIKQCCQRCEKDHLSCWDECGVKPAPSQCEQ